MSRREFTKKTKLLAWSRSGGNCETCTRKLVSGDIHYDHVIPDALGGEPTLENCAVLCRSCHSIKTVSKDVPTIAKSKRVQAANVGAQDRSRRPIAARPKPVKPPGKALPPRRNLYSTGE